MAEKKPAKKKIKLITRSSPPALKIALSVLIVCSMAALMTLRWVHNGVQEEIQNLKDEAAVYEHANSILDERLEDPDSVQNVLNIAMEQLGLVDPDTVLMDPQ